MYIARIIGVLGRKRAPEAALEIISAKTRELVQPLVMMDYRSPLDSLTLQVQPSGGPKRSQPNQTVPAHTSRILTASPCASLCFRFCVGTV
jgi:hypothetical protein